MRLGQDVRDAWGQHDRVETASGFPRVANRYFCRHGGPRRFLVVPRHDLGAHRRQSQRRRQAVLAQPHHREALSREQIGREGLHRIFSVARPTRAKIIEMIQNRITIVGSAQPFFSK